MAFSLLFLLAAMAIPQEQLHELEQAKPTLESLAQTSGLKWLAAQQQPDGSWESDRVKAWLEIMPPMILAAQVKSDHFHGQLPPLLLPDQKHSDDIAGSWPPGKPSTTTRLGQNRFEATCLNLLTLGYAKAPGRKHDGVLKREERVDESFPL